MDLPAVIGEFYKMAEEAGRKREELPLTSFGVVTGVFSMSRATNTTAMGITVTIVATCTAEAWSSARWKKNCPSVMPSRDSDR